MSTKHRWQSQQKSTTGLRQNKQYLMKYLQYLHVLVFFDFINNAAMCVTVRSKGHLCLTSKQTAFPRSSNNELDGSGCKVMSVRPANNHADSPSWIAALQGAALHEGHNVILFDQNRQPLLRSYVLTELKNLFRWKVYANVCKCAFRAFAFKTLKWSKFLNQFFYVQNMWALNACWNLSQ